MIIALKEFVEILKRKQFEAAMDKMSRDPAIRKECQAISEDFISVEENGNGEGSGKYARKPHERSESRFASCSASVRYKTKRMRMMEGIWARIERK